MNKVCRTCFKVLNKYSSCQPLDSVCGSNNYLSLRNKLSVCVPELKLDVLQYAVICSLCVEALNTSYSFKNKCLQTEQKILDFTRNKGCTKDPIYVDDLTDLTEMDLNDTKELDVEVKEIGFCNTQDTSIKMEPRLGGSNTLSSLYPVQNAVGYISNRNSPLETIDISDLDKWKRMETDSMEDDPLSNTSEIDMVKIEPGTNKGNEMKLNSKAHAEDDFEVATNNLINSIPFNPELDVEIREYNSDKSTKYSFPNMYISQNEKQQQQTTTTNSFCCLYCQQQFDLLPQLEAHIAMHAMLSRPLKCEMCERRFVRKDKLMLHMRIHTGEKPFKCTECGRCFSRKDKLNNHIRTHTGEKPHQCILCQKCFARKDKMNLHMKSQHWMALSNLEITVVKYADNANGLPPPALTENLPKAN